MRSEDGAFRTAFIVCSALALVPLWIGRYLPMVDMPQHAAQVAIWRDWNQTALGYSTAYWADWFTPYLLAYGLAWLFSWFVGALVGVKLVVTLAILALPRMVLRLLRHFGGDPWWSLLAFPVAFGYSFGWGFFSFIVAIPIALWALELTFRHGRERSARSASLLAVVITLLFFAHILLWGFVGLVAGAVLLVEAGSLRRAAKAWLPLLPSVPLAVIWMRLLQSPLEDLPPRPTQWLMGWNRVLEGPALILGMKPTLWVTAVGLLILVFPFMLGGRPVRAPARWIPFAAALVLYLFVPHYVFYTAYVGQRFSVLIVPCLLIGLTLRHQPTPRQRRLLAGLVVLWLGSLGVRAWGAKLEADPLHALFEQIEPGSKLLYMSFNRDSDFFSWPLYHHSGAWYQVEQGGLMDFSFASFLVPPFSYRPDQEPHLPRLMSWGPTVQDWVRREGGEHWDYFLIRVPKGEGSRPPASPQWAEPVAADPPWWLFRRRVEGGANVGDP